MVVVEDLNLSPTYRHSAVSPILRNSKRYDRGSKFEMQLKILEPDLGRQATGSRRDFHVTALDLPVRYRCAGRNGRLSTARAARADGPMRKVSTVEENKRVRRRIARVLSCCHGDRLRPIQVPDLPWLARNQWLIGLTKPAVREIRHWRNLKSDGWS